jgi:hypothetical protein
MIGSIRCECLDNIVVLSEWHLRRILEDYFAHYHSWRCHQSLEMDCPEPRSVQPPEAGEVRTTNIELAESGDERPRRRFLAELNDDPRSRAISCSLVCLGPEAPASQA